MKSVLQKFFNDSVSHFSPVIAELVRKVEIDETGTEHVHFVPLDSQSVIQANGLAPDYSLNNLIKSGVNPHSMNVVTSSPSRVENVSVVHQLGSDVDSLLNPDKDV